MAVESRNGKLNIFMPPVEALEDYLDIVAAVEETAEYLNIPVLIEGYAPPSDPRLNVIKVTPDPGVIEVNTHPAHSWREMIEITTGLDEDARNCPPRHGEIHARRPPHRHRRRKPHRARRSEAVGQPDPAPPGRAAKPGQLLAQPPVAFVSVLGMFVGPTCQSPRVDEARNDALYELEIAFRQIPDGVEVPRGLSIEFSGTC